MPVSPRLKRRALASYSLATGALDALDPRDIGRLEITSALEQFERVFLVSQPQTLGACGAHHHDSGRDGTVRFAVRRLPGKIIADAAAAPFGHVLLVERWAAIMAAGNVVPHRLSTMTT